MNKIMFNDKYGLTQAVLEGRKTMTRREPVFYDGKPIIESSNGYHYISTANGILLHKSRYHIGEVVAVAQAYKNVPNPFYGRATDKSDAIGWNNKMFVKPDLMPHHIRITDIRIEKLQDITDEDCMKEGVKPFYWEGESLYMADGIEGRFYRPKYVFKDLIDATNGKGTWESNPYVFVYEFKLID